jgi:hypothetical protein
MLALITRLRNSEYLFACKFDDDPPSIACIWLLTSGAIESYISDDNKDKS